MILIANGALFSIIFIYKFKLVQFLSYFSFVVRPFNFNINNQQINEIEKVPCLFASLFNEKNSTVYIVN